MAIGREILEGLGGGMAQISKDIRASRAKEATSKTPSLKDMLLLSYMNNKGDLDPNVAAAYGLTPDPAQVAGAAGQVQAPGQIGVQAGRGLSPRAQAIATGQQTPAVTDPILNMAGIDPTLRDVSIEAIAKEEALTPIKVGKEVASQAGKAAEETQRTFKEIENIVSTYKTQLGRAYKAQGGSGIVPGIRGVVGSKVKTEGLEEVAALEGTKNDAATKLAKLFVGGGRVPQRMIAMAKASLPTSFDTEEFADAKLRQTIINMSNMARANKGQGVMSPAEENKLLESVGIAGFDADQQNIVSQLGYDPNKWEVV